MISERKKPFSLHVLVCYAPTFRSSLSAKDNFFNDLQAVLLDLNSNCNDHFVLLGDFNAQVGSCPDVWNDPDTDEWHDVRGPCGFGEVNDAGKELLSFLSMNQSTICNTWFVKTLCTSSLGSIPKRRNDMPLISLLPINVTAVSAKTVE